MKADLIQTILDADQTQVKEELESMTVVDLEALLFAINEVETLQIEEGVVIYHNGRRYSSETPDIYLPEDFKNELIAQGQIRRV